MKIVLGIDSPIAAKVLMPLIGRLRLEDPCLDLVNVVDTTLPVTASSLMGAEPNGAFLDILQKSGSKALEEAEAAVHAHDYACRTIQEFGAPSRTLMEYATTSKADIIGVASLLRGPLESFVYGGVSRALAIGAIQSVLIAKGEIKPEGGIKAVFAVDHSSYCNACINRFLSYPIRGIESILLVTAFDPRTFRGLGHPNLTLEEINVAVEKRFQEKLEAIAQKFKAVGYNVDTAVREGHANDVIRTSMLERHADLLILGAHGHSFLERLLVGSVSLHQAVSESYSVLLMRK